MGKIVVSDFKFYDTNTSDREVIAKWSAPKGYENTTDHYALIWYYYTKAYPNTAFRKTDTVETVQSGQSSYTAPDEAYKVAIVVRPIAKTHKVNNQDVALWQGTNSTFTKTFEVSKPKQLGAVTDIQLWIEVNTDRTVRASWVWSQAHTASYLVTWQYGDGRSGRWYSGSEENETRPLSSYTPPDNAAHVRIRIRPISETRDVYGQDTAYWTASASSWEEYRFEAEPVENKGAITNVSLNLEPDTERSLFAHWQWSESHTAAYKTRWDYNSGIGWIFGKEPDNLLVKQDSYSPPANAKSARFRVLPIAEEHVQNGVTVPWWKAEWSDWYKYIFEAEAPPQVGTVSSLWLRRQSGTDRTLYASWEWDRENTESYSVQWAYDTGDNVWFDSGTDTVTSTQAMHNAESNAKRIRVRVKPNAKTHLDHGETVAYWEAPYTDWVEYIFEEVVKVPMVPQASVEQYMFKAEVDVYEENIVQVEFQVVENNSVIFATGIANVVTSHAAYSCSVTAGGKYKVRCRGISVSGAYSEWSEYSNEVGTPPSAPRSITSCRALSSTSVEVTWTAAPNAEEYEVEYTTNKLYFDAASSTQSSTVEGAFNRAILTGLETGEEWFFRVRASNDNGKSGWTDIVSVVLGKKPSAPTTWSQTSTGIIGDDITLYWVHNSEDGSRQRKAQIEISAGRNKHIEEIDTPVSDTEDEDEDESEQPINSYVLSTKNYSEGSEIKWRVRTMGVTGEYSDWSAARTIKVYAPPTLAFGADGTNLPEVLRKFPWYIVARSGPDSQTPVGYHLTISSNESYETINSVGEEVWVNKGQQIFSKYFDIDDHTLSACLTASDIDLENNISYLIHCEVYMNSGLSASAEAMFTVDWQINDYMINAEIGVNWENLSAYICPYCEDFNGNRVQDVLMSVYRRNFDGTFVLIADNIENQHAAEEMFLDSSGSYLLDSNGDPFFNIVTAYSATYVTDPHPALDYARYRIVAMSKTTGEIDFYDMPGYPIGEAAAVLQWDEKWSSFEDPEENIYQQPVWVGSLLKLPYNLDVSEEGDVDNSLVEYIGREHPVSYYGTQRGSTSTWNVDVIKEDTETLYQLRRLQRYAGDVYVREPSGLGYWANVKVSFSQVHCELVIPVTLTITRVEGGA